ncbi:MAG: DNA methyltransferase [Opitutaceae bacterium]|jgi:adenine-specific DNA methylase
MPKRAIEESFPIVEINRLAVPERNAFKPIYTMHKWFARRASCVFRSILLGALKPAGTDLMAEFYMDHGNDPDTQGKIILDPFMGGGTTVVEALRLGCKVVGIDLNPVAWFVVKTQVEPVDLPALDAAFARLAARPVEWSGKPLRETLLGLYRTDAPWTLQQPGASDLAASDVIYTFWVKSAPCTNPTCRKSVTLFGDYVVAAKSPTVRYHPDCTCPRCHKQFDWEIEPAALVADPRLMVHAAAYSGGTLIACMDSRELGSLCFEKADLVITDPPYADNVNYAELADFFYVWLRLILKDRYAWFAPEITPKAQEIVENKVRGVSAKDFGNGLQSAFSQAREKLKPDGLMVFTFHHAEDSAWVALLEAICGAGFVLEAIYPIQSEGSTSLNLQDNEAIAYDLIHVCRPRLAHTARKSWAGLKAQVRRRAQEEIRQIESGRYGGTLLPAPDVHMVLIGKCLEVYSRHYGAVVDWQGEPMPLHAVLKEIRLMVEQITSHEHPLPTELENVDAITQVWLLALADKREITVDSLSKTTRGVFEVSDLTNHKPPLLHKKRAKGSRSWAILTPTERLTGLREALMKAPPTIEQLDLGIVGGDKSIVIGPPLIDVLHLLIASAETGERLDPLIVFFDAQRGSVRAGLEWLKTRDPDRWAKPCDLLLGFYSDVQLTSLLSPPESKSN